MEIIMIMFKILVFVLGAATAGAGFLLHPARR